MFPWLLQMKNNSQSNVSLIAPNNSQSNVSLITPNEKVWAVSISELKNTNLG